MKKDDYILPLKYLLLVFVVLCFTNCEKDKDDLGELYGYANSANSTWQKVNLTLPLNASTQKQFNFSLRRKATETVEISFSYDASLIEQINKQSKKEYLPFPEDLFTLSNSSVTIFPDNQQSDSITISIKNEAKLEEGKEYVIPLKASVLKGKIEVPEKDSYIAFIVKAIGDNVDKSTGIKLFSCMEINDSNPLNHLSYKTKREDKFLFDCVILFSVNMLYSDDTRSVHLALNPQNKFLFDNADKYIKPLQDEGIKVVFSILPHHTAAGLTTLTDATCKKFALELKRFNDTYGLDGVFLDEEYVKGSGDPSVVLPGSSKEAASRLAYEIKEAMPDKLTLIYVYGGFRAGLVDVEGKKPGDFVDYLFPDYSDGSWDPTPFFEGVPRSRAGIYSTALGRAPAHASSMQKLRSDGFGANMIYGLGEYGDGVGQLMSISAQVLFDDELVHDGKSYPSEWAHLAGGDPEIWTGD